MEIKKEYFFDSYAIIEILRHNPNYLKYIESNVVITIFNLIEICWSVYKDFDEEKMNEEYNKFKDCVYDLNDSVIINALEFRVKYKNRDLSYSDFICYSYSK